MVGSIRQSLDLRGIRGLRWGCRYDEHEEQSCSDLTHVPREVNWMVKDPEALVLCSKVAVRQRDNVVDAPKPHHT